MAVPSSAVAQAPPAPVASEQQAGTLLVVESDGRSATLSLAELEHMPSVTVSLLREHERGASTAYAGPLLWTVLDHAGVVGQGGRERVHQVVTVTGRDGYTVALAVAELDPEFEGKSVIVATSADGKPIGAGELRLVVPGDKRAGRSVRNPARVVVR